jgi:O2-independent ubiquinone biosynthesis accessory factor UbiT
MRGHLPSIFARIGAVLPLVPLELVASRLIANALAARPSFATRLAAYAGRTFAIDPVDCPFAIVITPGAHRATVRLVRDCAEARPDARIAAPLVVLLGLIDGVYDGDALFFSRDLVIEGDTEAVLALRNALECAELDPATVLGLPSDMHAPFNRMATLVLDGARQTLGAPVPTGALSR